jgi:hypothetical protein
MSPRNVRNFWLELEVDGKKTRVATGPRGKTGGFKLTIYIRDDGSVGGPVRIYGTADEEGELRFSYTIPGSSTRTMLVTNRNPEPESCLDES